MGLTPASATARCASSRTASRRAYGACCSAAMTARSSTTTSRPGLGGQPPGWPAGPAPGGDRTFPEQLRPRGRSCSISRNPGPGPRPPDGLPLRLSSLMRSAISLLVCLALCTLTCGCGGQKMVKVKGTVTNNQKPLNLGKGGVSIVFAPVVVKGEESTNRVSPLDVQTGAFELLGEGK